MKKILMAAIMLIVVLGPFFATSAEAVKRKEHCDDIWYQCIDDGYSQEFADHMYYYCWYNN